MLAGCAVATTILAWASAYPLIYLALHDLAPLPLAAVRLGTAGAVALVWMCLAKPATPSFRDVLHFLVCGLLGVAL